MTKEELAFEVALWNAIHKWAEGNTHQRIKAVAEVKRVINSRPCPQCHWCIPLPQEPKPETKEKPEE